MSAATHTFQWLFGLRAPDRDRSAERGAPDRKPRMPLYIHDAILPCGDETMLLRLMREDPQDKEL
jgi:hypothetical protein